MEKDNYKSPKEFTSKLTPMTKQQDKMLEMVTKICFEDISLETGDYLYVRIDPQKLAQILVEIERRLDNKQDAIPDYDERVYGNSH